MCRVRPPPPWRCADRPPEGVPPTAPRWFSIEPLGRATVAPGRRAPAPPRHRDPSSLHRKPASSHFSSVLPRLPDLWVISRVCALCLVPFLSCVSSTSVSAATLSTFGSLLYIFVNTLYRHFRPSFILLPARIQQHDSLFGLFVF
ncbi:Major cell-surface adhesin PAc [Frankliniella fusca]|uniref:Major cell-surface adhesin PAc n=1 Tax=Frankliniella fusca TaxID=407009 RepID=A0AAE1HDN2_9NEOP|nr:Major cell-surface adhesin PAc [Frankliniella fusca]